MSECERKCIVALDVGTSSAKGCGFEIDSLTPVTPFITLKYEDSNKPSCWYQTCVKILLQLMHINPVLIALSGMMQNVIELDNENECIFYYNSNFAIKADKLLTEEGLDKIIVKQTGNYKNAASVVAKLKQINMNNRKKQPEVVFGAHSYVAWKLLGERRDCAYCDLTTASTTGLLNHESSCWLTEELLKEIGIDNFLLPQILKDASSIVGNIQVPGIFGVPLCHGAGDLGSLVCAAESWNLRTHAYVGTSGWIATLISREKMEKKSGSAFYLAHPSNEKLTIKAVPTTCAGGNVQKWTELLLPDGSFSEFDALASKSSNIISSSEPPLLYIPHLLGERAPISLPKSKAAFLGITNETEVHDLAKAVLMGVAFQFRWLYESLSQSDSDNGLCLLGGGSRSSVWAQIFSDVLNKNIQISTLKDFDATVYGAACVGCRNVSLKYSNWSSVTPRAYHVNQSNKIFPLWKNAVQFQSDLFSKL